MTLYDAGIPRSPGFLAEVVLDNSGGMLRPGMKGQARIRTTDRCLGWVLFHKPWNYLRAWLDL